MTKQELLKKREVILVEINKLIKQKDKIQDKLYLLSKDLKDIEIELGK